MPACSADRNCCKSSGCTSFKNVFALWGSIGGKTVQLVQSIGPVLLTGFQVKLAIADAGNLLGEVLACFAFFERLLGTFGVGNVQITSNTDMGLPFLSHLILRKERMWRISPFWRMTRYSMTVSSPVSMPLRLSASVCSLSAG